MSIYAELESLNGVILNLMDSGSYKVVYPDKDGIRQAMVIKDFIRARGHWCQLAYGLEKGKAYLVTGKDSAAAGERVIYTGFEEHNGKIKLNFFNPASRLMHWIKPMHVKAIEEELENNPLELEPGTIEKLREKKNQGVLLSSIVPSMTEATGLTVKQRREKIGTGYHATGYGRGINKKPVYIIDGKAYAYNRRHWQTDFKPLQGELEGYIRLNAMYAAGRVDFYQVYRDSEHQEYKPYKPSSNA